MTVITFRDVSKFSSVNTTDASKLTALTRLLAKVYTRHNLFSSQSMILYKLNICLDISSVLSPVNIKKK